MSFTRLIEHRCEYCGRIKQIPINDEEENELRRKFLKAHDESAEIVEPHPNRIKEYKYDCHNCKWTNVIRFQYY
jgi:hypothetical protein